MNRLVNIAMVAMFLIAPATAAQPKPNILLIVADDLGYGELSCQGNQQLATPQIDSLAKNGIRFTNAYVSAPVCGPSRAGLITGRYQQRFGFEFNLTSGGGGLPPGEQTLADRLKAAGYVTGMFGKWHLGTGKSHHPTQRGFDWFYGFMPACRTYQVRPGEMGKSLLADGTEKPTYLTDTQAEEAVAFIEQHREKPWFVYLPFGAVHAPPARPGDLLPQASPPKYRDRFAEVTDPKRRTFLGMELAMDDAIGAVLAKLRALQLEENTLIFFISDNGGPTWQTTSSNHPLRGSKGDVLEGGVRIPLIVQWKGHVPADKVDDRPVISLDIVPTALAAAGIVPAKPENLEGVNLLSYLTGRQPELPSRVFCWRYGKKYAARTGDWKLADQGDGAKLYDLKSDIGEQHDLAAQEPEKVKQLQAAYDAWNARNVEPKWGHEGRRPKPASGAASQDNIPQRAAK